MFGIGVPELILILIIQSFIIYKMLKIYYSQFLFLKMQKHLLIYQNLFIIIEQTRQV